MLTTLSMTRTSIEDELRDGAGRGEKDLGDADGVAADDQAGVAVSSVDFGGGFLGAAWGHAAGESEGLHAPVAVNLSATVREVMPSLEPKDAEAPVINALRKEVDRRQIEFVKSGKLVPVPFSSRHYDFKRQKWVFGKATDEVIADV